MDYHNARFFLERIVRVICLFLAVELTAWLWFPIQGKNDMGHQLGTLLAMVFIAAVAAVALILYIAAFAVALADEVALRNELTIKPTIEPQPRKLFWTFTLLWLAIDLAAWLFIIVRARTG